jgi:hypothetical protein
LLSRQKTEFLLSVVIVFFLVWALWEARHWPGPSKLFPWSLGFTVLALALLQVGVAWRALKESRAGALGKTGLGNADGSQGAVASPSVSQHSVMAQHTARQRVVTICCWIVAFFLGLWLLGFKLGSLCLTFAFLKFTAGEKWMISAAIALGTYLFFWLVFDMALGVPLGNGLIADYLALN